MPASWIHLQMTLRLQSRTAGSNRSLKAAKVSKFLCCAVFPPFLLETVV